MEPCYQQGAGVSWHKPSKKLACQYFCPYSIYHIQDVSEYRASVVPSAERGKKPRALRLLVCLSRFQAPRNIFLNFLLAISDYLPASNPSKPQQYVKKLVSMAGRLLQVPFHIWLIPGGDTNLHGKRVMFMWELCYSSTQKPHGHRHLHMQSMHSPCNPLCTSLLTSLILIALDLLTAPEDKLLLALTSLKNSFTASHV